jgi:hypothetical protein
MDAAQRVALTHFAIPVRKVAYEKIEQLLAIDQPIIPAWWPRQIQPINPDFKNFTPNAVEEAWNSYQWEI